MIQLDAVDDGFSISLNGRRALLHSARAPLIELGTAETSARRRGGSYKLGERRQSVFKAKAWKLASARDGFIDVEFDGLARMAVRESGGALRISLSRYDRAFNRFTMRLPATPGESVFGCGEQFSRLDLKGELVPLWSEERGAAGRRGLASPLSSAGRGGAPHATGLGQPSFVTSERSYVHVGTNARCVFDFRRPRLTTLRCWAIPDELVVGFADDMPAAVGALSAAVGRQPPLPAWTWDGVWLGVEGGAAELRRKLETTRGAGVPVGAVWVRDWCGRTRAGAVSRPRWDWRYDRELYPDLPSEIAALARDGIRFIGYVNPYLAADGELYAEASGKGFCVKRDDGSDYLLSGQARPAAMVDLFNPEAFSWIASVIAEEMLGIGMAGWMADAGEHLPVDAVLHGGRDPLLAHNEYPVLWAGANAEAIRKAGKEGEATFFCRSGWAGSTRHAGAFWAGDRSAGWNRRDGLPSVIPASLSLGFSGAGIWHSDIGGDATTAWTRRSDECLARWAETAAFTPIMRTHEGDRPEANAQPWSSPAALAHFARLAAVWSALAPYHAETMAEYASSGLPPIRHTWLHYEDQPELRALDYQYLYGRDLLVAPVVEPGAELSNAVLPADHWVHLWTSREFRGGEVTIEAPLGYPPVFYRAASPWASLFESLRRSTRKL